MAKLKASSIIESIVATLIISLSVFVFFNALLFIRQTDNNFQDIIKSHLFLTTSSGFKKGIPETTNFKSSSIKYISSNTNQLLINRNPSDYPNIDRLTYQLINNHDTLKYTILVFSE